MDCVVATRLAMTEKNQPGGRRRGDALNARYGRDAVTLGVTADFGSPCTGVRIAFTRIPDRAEFHE